MDAAISALIGGVFTLLGIFLNHHLALKREKMRYESSRPQTSAPDPHVPPTPVSSEKTHTETGATPTESTIPEKLEQTESQPVYAPPRRTTKRDVSVGFAILLVDIVLIIAIVNLFNLNTTDSVWENVFAFFTIGVLPVYGFFRIIRGTIRAVSS